MSRRRPVWLLLDAAAVLVFAAIGRRSHEEGITVAGTLQTAWPFLVGTGLGWLACRAWRRPVAVIRTGVPVWVVTVAVAMVLRRGAGAGTAPAFVVVATLVLGAFLLGWRLVLNRWPR
jgi:hypothetical protein